MSDGVAKPVTLRERVEQGGDLVVDVLGAVVGVEVPDGKGKDQDEPFQDRQQEAFADPPDGSDELELGDLVDGIDQVRPFDAVQVALLDAVDAQVAGPILRRSPAIRFCGR